MRKWLRVFLVTAFGALFSAHAVAGEEKGDKTRSEKGEKGDKGEKKKPTGWDVVQQGSELKAVQAEKVADLQKENQKEVKAAREKAKKEKKRPEFKRFIVLKRGLATKEEAEKYIDKLKKDREKDKEDKDKKAGHKGDQPKADHKEGHEGHK